jgi:hypothetical protein
LVVVHGFRVFVYRAATANVAVARRK